MPAFPRRRASRSFAAIGVLAAAGLGLAAVPTALASTAHQAKPSYPANVMYRLSVQADGQGASALAQRLADAGYDVTARTNTVVYVVGSDTTASHLSAMSGVHVVARQPAAPTGPVAPAPQSQNSILPTKLQGKHYPTYYGGYRTVKAYQQFESDLVKAYPNLVTEYQYGTSHTDNQPLNVLCLTEDPQNHCKLTPNSDRPRFLLETQIHAREIATSEMSWRFLTDLVDGYGTDAQITSLLQSSEIWVAPQVNPDGVELVQAGMKQSGTGEDSSAWQRKNDDEDQTPAGGCAPPWAGSQPGVDMNRNWSVHYGGASTSKDPCSEVFIGKKAMSEPETKGLETLLTDLFKDQKSGGPQHPAPLDTTGEMLTMHTDGGVNLIPWDWTTTVQAPNDAGLRSLGFRQSYYTGLPTGQSGQVLYNVGGGTDDWAYAKLGIAAGTWELADTSQQCSGFFPAYSCMDSFANTYIPGLIYTAAASREPYMLSLGPTITDLGAKLSGGSVTVTATADDAAFGAQGFGKPASQNVTDARIYVGTSPWDGGTATAMTIKGHGTTVTATASVKPGSDQVMAWVQAKDADGNWGPAVAVWIPAS